MPGKVYSSHGTLMINLVTGKVISSEDIDPSFGTIPEKFDLKEYRDNYPEDRKESHFDILDIGYWLPEGGYVKPDSAFRSHIAKGKQISN